MSGDILLSIGRKLATGEQITADTLQAVLDSLTAQVIAGTLTAREIADGSIPESKLSAAVRSQLGLPDGSVTLAKLASGVLTADAAGRLKMADSFITTAKIGDAQVTAAKLEGSLYWPVGLILPYGGESVPTGWFECTGAAISRTTYSALYTAIATLWGVGDGTTTFNIPDLRGYFLRGWNNGAPAGDPDAASRTGGDHVGSSQADGLKSHTHTLTAQQALYNIGGATYAWNTGGATTATSNATGGNETRPKNKYVMYIIKY
jgi:microcystin-dependent protein